MAQIPAPLQRSWLKVQLLVREYTALSPATIRAISANTLRMARLDRRDLAIERRPAAAVSAGAFLSGAPIDVDGELLGATVAFERATLEVVVVAPDMVRLSWGPDDEPIGWATSPSPQLPAPGPIEITVEDDHVTVATSLLAVRVDASGAAVLDLDGELRYHEIPPLRRGASRTYRRRLRPAEALCGLGEQAAGLDLRGTTLRLWNRDPGGAWGPGQNPLYASIPVMLSRSRAGATMAFVENSFDAELRVGAPSSTAPVDVEMRFVGGMVRTWVAIGDHASVLERYTGLTGRHPMPPRWALGYHQSRWGYRTSDEASSVLSGYRDRGIPLSVLHLDIDYMDHYRVFSVSPDRYGDLPALREQAEAQGARLVTIVDPAVASREHDPVYAEGMAAGHFVTEDDGEVHVGTVWPGWAVFPDFTRPATRDWWASLYPRLLDQGIDGIWHDMNEPTSITLTGDRTIPRSARHDNEGRGGDHRESHNVYGLLMNRSGHEGLTAARPDRRPFIVSRSGWAGMQRYAWNWTADVASSEAGLLQQVTTFLGLGLSGVAFTGSDIGGFSGIPTPALYLRWLELGVVSPFARTHSVLGAPAREPWCWPDSYAEQVEALIALRYRILPYLYTLAGEAAATGAPLLRPLWWGQPDADAPAEPVDQPAMLLGSDLLCVLTGAPRDTTIVVDLPPGGWWRFRPLPGRSGPGRRGAELLEGGGPTELDSILGQPAWLVRAGAIVPLDDAWAHGSRPAGGLAPDHAPGLLSFHVFPDREGRAEGTCLDDAGDGHGPQRLDHLVLDGDTLNWRSHGEHRRPRSVSVVVHGVEVLGARCDGVAIPVGDVVVSDGATTLRLPPFSELVLVSP
jgi:alpha-glucosidase